jgi:transketolase
MTTPLEQESINTIRTLSIDAIEKANSGHPGLPMGAAPMAYTLWAKEMKHNPADPHWINRDRFVLSAGHGSMLLYSLLCLFNYGLTIDDLKQYHCWGSRTPGHPEFGHTVGVEATTGPLGQGIGMAVGMAMAEAHLGTVYNRNDYDIIHHYTYVLCGDGDLMEGVASEAASLAGHLHLGRLIFLYDSNHVTLDGDTNMSFSENVRQRFAAYGWSTLLVENGNEVKDIAAALEQAKVDEEHPTLIEVRTKIGYGAPKGISGTNKVHGKPLGPEVLKATKENYHWHHESFFVPEEVKNNFLKLSEMGKEAEKVWREMFASYQQTYPKLADQLKAAFNGELDSHYANQLPTYPEGTTKATRQTSGEIINGLAKTVPQLFGGAADLSSSNKTTIKEGGDFQTGSYDGRNIWFGVREFAMLAAVNGMALHGGVKPFGATFFTFSDYAKAAIRLAALMRIPSIFVFTHDSIAVGEDGPTHEPIEQLAGLRAIPNLNVIRPADGNEVREAWKIAVESQHTPTLLVLTRQGVETLPGEVIGAMEGVRRGGYTVSPAPEKTDGILIATGGTEVSLAVKAQELLKQTGLSVSVVSLPCWELFRSQSQNYRDSVLPPSVKARVGIEMAASLGWHEFIGLDGALVTIDRFGASAPGNRVMIEYGFTPEHIAETMRQLIKSNEYNHFNNLK